MAANSVRLTVSQLRQEVYKVSGRPSQGAGSMAGQIFHQAVASLMNEEAPAYWKRVLSTDIDEAPLLSALYASVVGPELVRLHGALAESGAEVLTLWRGVEQDVHWFCGLLSEAMTQGRIRYDGKHEHWLGAERLFQAECDVEAQFCEPGWRLPVVVSGRIDQFLRSGPDRWCVVEWKLGAGHAEADAAQLCLYHELLGGHGDAALLHFGDAKGPEEILLPHAALAQARPALMALIARLAGVAGATSGGAVENKAEQHCLQESQPDWRKLPGEEEREIGRRIERTLHEYNAQARIVSDPIVGPAFLRYVVEPLHGVPVGRIERCGAELQIRLGLSEKPVIHRVEGGVAVDVRRRERGTVTFASLRPSMEANRTMQGCSRLLAGMDLHGRLHLPDLAKECPHLLVGGQSGSGKTEWLRTAVASLLVTNTPATLRWAVVDPKKNAFPELAGSPFLWRPDALIDSPDQAVLDLLLVLIEEMNRRNGLLGKAAADSLADYGSKTGEIVPRLVLVVDEFAELLLSGGRKQRDAFEQAFIRIAAMGRAAGIHLILATQRPSRQVVSGNLKANLPGKIALRVSTRVDSGVLIDQPGAELLLGRGDLLLAGLSVEPVRLQAAWLSDEERSSLFRGPVNR